MRREVEGREGERRRRGKKAVGRRGKGEERRREKRKPHKVKGIIQHRLSVGDSQVECTNSYMF